MTRVVTMTKAVGRKKIPQSEKSKQYGIQLYKAERDLLVDNAERLGIKFSSLMRNIIYEWLRMNDADEFQKMLRETKRGPEIESN